jgi:ABC-type uncharacterized transport system involved in gliding motility auxiliary subunit
MMNNFMDSIKRLFKSRSLKYGTNSIVLIAVVIAIAVLVNILVDFTGLKWDLTPNKLYSLGSTSNVILSELKQDVTIYGLLDEGKIKGDADYSDVASLLEQYSKYPRIKVEYVDPDKNPGFVKDLDPDNLKNINNGDFVIKSGNKMKRYALSDLFQEQLDQQSFQTYRTGSKAEQVITGAIKSVTSEKTPTVYFTEGHDELKVDSDYTSLKQYLEMNNYEVKSINLLTQTGVPADAEMLILASPKKDLSADESDKLKSYLKDGGKAVFMFDPLESNTVFTGFEDVLSMYNISLNYDKVKENDQNRHVPNNDYDILPDIQADGTIIPQSFNMIMPKSRSINILNNKKDYITVTSLMKTSDKAVGEQIDKARGENLAGPLDLAVASEYKGGKNVSKILVMGNASFMTDTAINQYGQYSSNGAAFFLTSMNWMQDKKDDTVIAPKNYDYQTLKITATQASVMNWVVILLLPLLILGAGLFVYLRRRHL